MDKTSIDMILPWPKRRKQSVPFLPTSLPTLTQLKIKLYKT